MYCGYLRAPAIFLCTEEFLEDAKKMKHQKIPGQNLLVVLRIPAARVAVHDCDADRTTDDTVPDVRPELTLRECLDDFGYLACFGIIPPECIELVEYQDEASNWVDVNSGRISET